MAVVLGLYKESYLLFYVCTVDNTAFGVYGKLGIP